jgi:uncharacterized coiled-coil protein SlyX
MSDGFESAELNTLYRLITAQFDTLEERMDGKFKHLIQQQAQQNESLEKLNRTVRGHNGTPGLVTQVALLNERIENLKQEVDEESAGEKPAEDEEEKGAVRWGMVGKFVIPIVASFLTWLLITVLPEVLVHLRGGK